MFFRTRVQHSASLLEFIFGSEESLFMVNKYPLNEASFTFGCITCTSETLVFTTQSLQCKNMA